jgi:hypothetical protein
MTVLITITRPRATATGRAVAIIVSALGTSNNFCAQGSNNRATEDFPASVFGKLATVVTAGSHKSGKTCAGKSTLGKMALVVMVRASGSAALASHNGSLRVVLVIRLVTVAVPIPTVVTIAPTATGDNSTTVIPVIVTTVTTVTTVRADFVSFLTTVIVLLVFPWLTANRLAVTFTFTFTVLSNDNGRRCWCFLEDDPLLRHALTDDDRRRRRLVDLRLPTVALHLGRISIALSPLNSPLYAQISLPLIALPRHARLPVPVSVARRECISVPFNLLGLLVYQGLGSVAAITVVKPDEVVIPVALDDLSLNNSPSRLRIRRLSINDPPLPFLLNICAPRPPIVSISGVVEIPVIPGVALNHFALDDLSFARADGRMWSVIGCSLHSPINFQQVPG